MDLGKKYLDLLKKSLLNEIYPENELRIQALAEGWVTKSKLLGKKVNFEKLHHVGHYFPEKLEELKKGRETGKLLDSSSQHLVYSHTMIGRKRLNNLEFCLDQIRLDQIEGDAIECGVWQGGSTIFMKAYLEAYDIKQKTVWVADSFEGVPSPTLPEEQGIDLSKKKFPGLSVSVEQVRQNFEKYDLLDNNVKFIKGWFGDTLNKAPIEKLSLLRLDGDLYESTMDALNALYHKVVPGGFIIVDDYGALLPCKQAIEDFRDKNQITTPLKEIDWTGVYWRKE